MCGLGRSWREHAALAAQAVGSVLLQRAPSRHSAGRSVLFHNPVEIIEARRPAEVRAALQQIEGKLAQGFHLAGFIAYEAGFALEPSLRDLATELPDEQALVWLGCYAPPECETLSWHSFHANSPRAFTSELQPELPSDYESKVEAIRSLIAEGATYQANLTAELEWYTDLDPAVLYAGLFRAQPVPYAALLHPNPASHILSLSPELFFTRDGTHILTRPMKGTAPPGMDLAETVSQAAWLAADEKNRAENVMIVDLLRNDLNRICKVGSVEATKLFEVERHPTVLQMTSTIEGHLRPALRYCELFEALFPSGSIVGAPKINTMRLLHRLEARNRGVYTGAIGFISPGEKAEFSVAIRTVSLRAGHARFGVGAGITYGSVPALEAEECRTKAAFLTRQPDDDFQLIETLLLADDSYAFRDEHLDRISASAEYFSRPFDRQLVLEALEDAKRAWLDRQPARVRILLDGDGSVTWSAASVQVSHQSAVRLLLHGERTSAEDHFLRHKTTRRSLYDAALTHANAQGFADALFLNTREELTEGAIHNLVLSIAGQWFTPPLASGVLPGVYRQHLLQQSKVAERVLKLRDLKQAEEVFLCNSVRGMRRVERIAQQRADGPLETIWSRVSQRES